MIRIEYFKENLIDRLEEKGGVYASKLMQGTGKNSCRYKKFFAFKTDEKDMMKYLDFATRAIMLEINCNYFMFNLRIEIIKDTKSFNDIIRGMVYYERIKRTDD